MANVINSNFEVQSEINQIRTRLNSGLTMRLFTNNSLTVTAATTRATFTEATYAGYAAQSVGSAFAASFNVTTGKYETDSSQITFPAATSGSQTVYGWYIEDGTDWYIAANFDSPITMSSTSPALGIIVAYQQWAAYLCGCP